MTGRHRLRSLALSFAVLTATGAAAPSWAKDADDPVDQFQSVLRALPEADEGHIRALSGGRGADILNVDLACDHLVSEANDDRCDERQSVLALVGDQDAQVLGFK